MSTGSEGAGTRVLLDYRLKTAGIRPEEIDGYDKEARPAWRQRPW
ncbi:MAG: substrate-binding domain-containing protein [[Clostridium] scindens]